MSWLTTRWGRRTSSTASRSVTSRRNWKGSLTVASFDLCAHAKASGLGDKLSYFDQDAWMCDAATRTGGNSFEQWVKTTSPTPEQVERYKFVPHVIEPSAGADRFTLAVLCEAYTETTVPDAKGVPQPRTFMRFHPRLAPVKCAVFPLVNKDGMPEKALSLYRELKPAFNTVFDDKGAVGRRYARQDEAGTPFCVTIDTQTLGDDTVTIRERDTQEQRRVPTEPGEGRSAESVGAGSLTTDRSPPVATGGLRVAVYFFLFSSQNICALSPFFVLNSVGSLPPGRA